MSTAKRHLEKAISEFQDWRKRSAKVKPGNEDYFESRFFATRSLQESYRQFALALLHASPEEAMEVKAALSEFDREAYGV
jgi:hypothetical protein